jgi:co-chaperonin GroES (HSP10)
MIAIGRNLIINKHKVGSTKTKGGLLLAESQREDIRYHKGEKYHIIRFQDVVVVL